jgi:hypothetical protein
MKLIKTMRTFNSGCKMFTRSSTYLFVSVVLAACGGGGGGSAPVPEAVVRAVADAQVVEGNTGTTQLEFLVTLDKAVVSGVNVVFSTTSTSKTGIQSTGSAKEGASCSVAGTDYIQVTGKNVPILAGASSGKLTVTVCGDTTFEPNETLKITWASAGSSGGSAIGTIVNDDAGGLSGTGATSVMGGVTAFGRDTNALTNSDLDGAKGFSFEKQPSAAAWDCTYDKVTGLTWQRPSVVTKTYTNLSADITAANAGAGLCGQTGWRAPTVNELLSLMDVSRNAATYGAVNADREGVQDFAMTVPFWTSEQATLNNTWIVDSSNGGAVSYQASDALAIAVAGVRLVRGGDFLSGNSRATVCNDVSRYTDYLDGTVEDVKTGLMWKKCPEGLSGASCGTGTPITFSTDAESVSRQSASNADIAVLGLGYSDWRIPTVKELASLVDRCTSNPAISSATFPATNGVSYISATLNASIAGQFWYVDFAQGTVSVNTVSGGGGGKYLRLVRAGQ